MPEQYFDRAMWATFAMLTTDMLARFGVLLAREIERLP